MISTDYYDILLRGLDGCRTVSRLVHGVSWTAAVLSDGSCGVAMHTTGETKVEVIAQLDEATAYAIPLVKGADNDSLRAAINDALKQMRESGKLAELSVKYFGADLTEN